MSLDALKQAIATRLAAHPKVKVGTLQALSEFVTLTVEPEHGPHRFLRVAVAELDRPVPEYIMRWAVYRGASERDDTEGSTVGDLAFTLSAIDHWIIEGRPWREASETRTAPRGSPDG